MAGIGHIALGLAVGRYRARTELRRTQVRSMLGYAALAMLPDADVIGFRFHVPYASEFGHRGATHSLVFAALVGVIAFAVQRLRARPALGSALTVTLVVASHGLLDALTDGGLGVALFWPVSLTRWFAPVNPIPVSPIGTGVFSDRGLRVALTELLLFAPCWLYALWPRRVVQRIEDPPDQRNAG